MSQKSNSSADDGFMPHCTTHHHGCECREWMIEKVLSGILKENAYRITTDPIFLDLNELYIFLYGREPDNRIEEQAR